MNKDWIMDALHNAPEKIDANMTILEFVEKYSKKYKLIDPLVDILLKLKPEISKLIQSIK